jgi:predicted dehydrogenase
MADAKLRVTVVGTGMIANAGHIPAWKSLPEAEVVAVADAVEANARATAKRHDIPRAYTALGRMLGEQRPDLVIVCTPNRYHKEHVLTALRAGAHVLCEKPLATSVADAEAMFKAADAAKRMLYVGQNLRFYGTLAAAKDFAVAGELGEVYHAATTCMRRRGIPTWGRFHMKKDSVGGPLWDIGVHMLDALLWIMGNPRVVAASGMTYARLARGDEGLVTSLADSGAPVGVFTPRPYDPREFDVEDLALGLLRTEGDATIVLTVSWAANVPDGFGGTMVLGTKGGLQIDPELKGLTLARNLSRYQVNVTPKLPPDPDVPFHAHWTQAEHVVRVIRGGAEPCVKREEALNVVRALEALYRSATERREVTLARPKPAGRGGARKPKPKPKPRPRSRRRR